MLVHWTRVDVRVPETGEYRTLEWSELDPRSDAALVGLMMRQLDNGMTDLRALPEYFYRHPDQCPACEEAALPGPTVHGVWLDEAWHREFVVAGIQGTGERVQRFANRDFAETIAQKRLTALLQHRRSRKPLDPQLGDLARLPDRPPHYTPVSVCETSQLWLWTEDPCGGSGWPDEALIIDVDGAQLVTLTGTEVQARAAAQDARRKQQDKARREAAVIGDMTTILDNHTITWYTPDPKDPGVLISIRDHESSRAARRILSDGTEEPLDGAPAGLTLFGRSRSDRPAFPQAARRAPEYAYLITGVAQGRGTTTGS